MFPALFSLSLSLTLSQSRYLTKSLKRCLIKRLGKPCNWMKQNRKLAHSSTKPPYTTVAMATTCIYRISSSDLQDVVLYLSDLAITLKCFINVYPRCTLQLASDGWVERVVSFHGTVTPVLQEHWHSLKGELEK